MLAIVVPAGSEHSRRTPTVGKRPTVEAGDSHGVVQSLLVPEPGAAQGGTQRGGGRGPAGTVVPALRLGAAGVFGHLPHSTLMETWLTVIRSGLQTSNHAVIDPADGPSRTAPRSHPRRRGHVRRGPRRRVLHQWVGPGHRKPERVAGGPTGTYVVPAGIHKIKHVIVIMQENRRSTRTSARSRAPTASR